MIELENIAAFDEYKNKERTRPKPIEIFGMEKPFHAILDSFVGNWRIADKNKTFYRNKWEEFLPEEIHIKKEKITEIFHNPWSMAYVPRVSIRKSICREALSDNNGIKKMANWPYFIFVLNTARDTRPQTPAPEGVDVLQQNVLDRGMIICENVENFDLTANGFPYHYYASLLISKEKRPQGAVTPQDITTWIKFSFLTGQYVFFNSYGAGASRPERFHAQVVDPEVLRYEGEILKHPIINENLIKRKLVSRGVYELIDYPVGALIFIGKDAPYQAAKVVNGLEGMYMPYNILVHNEEVYVVGRNRIREKSDCIGRKVGGYEISGIILIGNVEDPLFNKSGLERVVHGCEVFSEVDYSVICNNISAASIPVAVLLDMLG